MDSYYRYWGKARTKLEVDYCTSDDRDEDIAVQHDITVEELHRRVRQHGWKKAPKGSDYAAYHLLPYHCLDVAAVGWLLLNPDTQLGQHLSGKIGVQAEWLQRFFTCCLALHDIGKFSRAFQGLRYGMSDVLVTKNPKMPYTERHDSLGFLLWKKHLLSGLKLEYAWIENIGSWIEIVTGHHGQPPKKSGGRLQNTFMKEDRDASIMFVRDIVSLLLEDFDVSPLQQNAIKKHLKTVSWRLAGVAVLADWLGSNQTFFKYVKRPMSLVDYWEKHALPSANKVLQTLPAAPQASAFGDVYSLFPAIIKQATPLQQYAMDEPLADEPQLFILEDVTGAGKTEAALTLTHRLLDAGLADGLYVALPTMATANAMYERLGKVYRRLFDAHAQPSLVLAHGARELSDAFRQSVAIVQQCEDAGYGKQEDSASIYCNAWIADNRKKALLADVGVGTLDQALLGVLPARHQSLRLLGLARKVLLVDEVHAYDSYMQVLLDNLLEMHARQGGSVILLSATLPQAMREKLVAAFHRGLDRDAPQLSAEIGFPLATHTPPITAIEQVVKTRAEVQRTVSVQRLDAEQAIFERIRQATAQGQCVCWLRNTVKAARQSYLDLSAWLDIDHLHLFHSRFAMLDRQRIEKDALARFGKKSGHEQRSGHVLIATQVVEQSLDLDFDVMITDLAPIDLLIQRAGRLHRHIRDARGKRLDTQGVGDQRGEPVLHLFTPDPTDDVDENWLKTHQSGTQSVYPHIGQLWLGARLLMYDLQGRFTMPDDARALIEGVYAPADEGRVPKALLDASTDAEVKHMIQCSMGNFNALKLDAGYTRSSGDWDEETRIPTRLSEQETISVVLVRLEQGRLQPYAKVPHHAWALSVVTVPQWEWTNARQYISDEMQAMIDGLKAKEKELRWLEVFPITNVTARFYDANHGWHSGQGEQP